MNFHLVITDTHCHEIVTHDGGDLSIMVQLDDADINKLQKETLTLYPTLTTQGSVVNAKCDVFLIKSSASRQDFYEKILTVKSGTMLNRKTTKTNIDSIIKNHSHIQFYDTECATNPSLEGDNKEAYTTDLKSIIDQHTVYFFNNTNDVNAFCKAVNNFLMYPPRKYELQNFDEDEYANRRAQANIFYMHPKMGTLGFDRQGSCTPFISLRLSKDVKEITKLLDTRIIYNGHFSVISIRELLDIFLPDTVNKTKLYDYVRKNVSIWPAFFYALRDQQVMPPFISKIQQGGSKVANIYTKISNHVGKDGRKSILYERNNKHYIRRKDKKSGKFIFKLVKI